MVPKGKENLACVMVLDKFQDMTCVTFTIDKNLVNVWSNFQSTDTDDKGLKWLVIKSLENFAGENSGQMPNGILLYTSVIWIGSTVFTCYY